MLVEMRGKQRKSVSVLEKVLVSEIESVGVDSFK